MEVAPYGPGLNFVGAAASGCQNPPPSLLGQKNPQELKQQSAGGIGRLGAPGTAQGVMEVTPYALFLTLAGWRRQAAPGRRTALQGAEKQRKHPNNNQLLIEGAREQQEDGGGCMNTAKILK